jgi:lipopolysaccharide export LptBFGC system permease protein LptF
VARPLAKDRWLLENGSFWHADADGQGSVLTTRATQEEAQVPFQARTVPMKLDELWLRNLGLSPQYLRLGELRKLAQAPIMSRDLSSYKTRLQLIFGETVFTCLMALLGAALSMLHFTYQTRWVELVMVLLTGYLAHFASKAFQLMGEFGYMAPFFAGWLAPLLLVAGLARTLLVIQKTRGLGVHLADTPHYSN